MIKLWLEMVTEHGCVITGRSDIQRHHVVGRARKHNKVHIGEIFVLPLVTYLHDVHSNHPLNVTHFRHKFTGEYGSQASLWEGMVVTMIDRGWALPFEQDVYDSIMGTNY